MKPALLFIRTGQKQDTYHLRGSGQQHNHHCSCDYDATYNPTARAEILIKGNAITPVTLLT